MVRRTSTHLILLFCGFVAFSFLLDIPCSAQETANPIIFGATVDWGLKPEFGPKVGEYKVSDRVTVSGSDDNLIYDVYGNGDSLAYAKISEVEFLTPETKILAERKLAPTGYSEDIDVFIEVTNISSSAKTVNIIEQPPARYSLNKISHNGIVENGSILWNVNLDPGTTILHYTAYPFSSDIRNATFHGSIGSDSILGQNQTINYRIYISSFNFMVFTGIPLVLFLIHFCLFLFYPRLKEHLYYALFLLFSATTHYFCFKYPFIGTHSYEATARFYITLFFNSLQFVMLLIFFHKHVFQKLTWYIWILIILFISKALFYALALCMLVHFPDHDFSYIVNSPFSLVFTSYYASFLVHIVLVRVLFYVLYKKLSGSLFIAIGLFLWSIINLWGFLNYYLDFPAPPIKYPEMGGIANILLLLSMSIYLAYRFAKTQEELEILNVELEDRVEQRTQDLNTMNTELQEANAQLIQLDQMKTQFVSQASHDLRTPLTAIKGSLDNLLMGIAGALNEKQQKVMTRATSSVDRLTNLINDVLDLNRIETGRIVLEKTNIPFKTLVENIINENSPAAEQKWITLNANLREEINLHIDGGKIERVVGELISNAIKYTPDDGTVEVDMSCDDDMLSLSVKDSGIGMTPEECAKIWERFYRTSASQKFAKGSGLGLSIAKELVELHEGTLTVESAQGLGTKFTLSLPLNC